MPRYSNRRSITSSTTYQPASFTPAGFEAAVFVPKSPNLSYLQKSLDTLDLRKERTDQQMAAINAALSKVVLNAAEDEWKTNYINNINAQVDNAAQFGDYSAALETATRLAGEAVTNPGLIGRERANKAFEEYKKLIENRTDLNQVTKNRWLATNPYHYEDKYDANGNVVGGTAWTPDWNPVSRYDMTKLYGLAQQLAAKEAGGGESASFLDENGNITSDPSKGFYGMAVKRGSKWERLSEQKLKNVFNALFAQAPEAMDSLLQDMDDRKWQYDNATDEGKKAFIGSDIIDSKGVMRTPQEYLAHRVNPILSEMAYNHVWSSVDYGSAYANYAKAQEQKRLNMMLDSDNPTTITKAIEIDMSERAGAAGANLKSATTKIKELFPGVVRTKEYSDAIRNGNYTEAANILRANINKSSSPVEKANMMKYINLLKTEGEIYTNLTTGFTREEREALAYVNAVESGSDMPNAADNRFSEQYSKKFNNLFGVRIGGGGIASSGIARGLPNGSDFSYTVPASKIAIKFRTEGQKEFVLSKLGNINSLKQKGISLGKIKGEDCLIVDKNTTELSKVADAFIEKGYRLFGWDNTEIYRLDDNGDIIKSRRPGGIKKESAPIVGRNALDALSYFSSNNTTLNNAKSIADKAFRKKTTQKLIEPVQIFPFDNHNTMVLREMRDKGYITNEDYNNRIKEYKDNNLREVVAASQDLNNFRVWGAMSDEPGNQVRLNQEEVQEYAKAIRDAYAADCIEIAPGEEPTGKGYGTTIIIHPKAKTGNSPEIKARVMYVDGLLATKAAESLASTPKALWRREYKINKVANPNVEDIYGNRITFDDSETNYKAFVGSKYLEQAYDMLAIAKQNGETLTEEQADRIAKDIIDQSGTVVDNMKSSIDIISDKLLQYWKGL